MDINVQYIKKKRDINITTDNSSRLSIDGGDKKGVVVWSYNKYAGTVDETVIKNCILVVNVDEGIMIHTTTVNMENVTFRDYDALDINYSILRMTQCRMLTLKNLFRYRDTVRIVELKDCNPTEACTFEQLQLDDCYHYLESVIISNCRLYGTVKIDFKNLIKLDLSHNELTEFRVKNLPKLKVLDLSHNRLDYIDSKYLLRMPELESIDVSHNMLKSIYPLDTYDKLTKLEYINVSYNRLSEVPICTLQRPCINTVNIAGNPIITKVDWQIATRGVMLYISSDTKYNQDVWKKIDCPECSKDEICIEYCRD